ncbi:RNA-binding protein [Trichothermofontia sichuanensis B231]|uniref:RNA recognition motif domain-containing protein n=1 Tax=Trichothermofontia sichuanensis TaxID=3045816 RepID=UPI0022471C26|nr:RNA-binding protein [Trichothermofontia sichuanensis]UZQ54027.1 RNA-binding protein [Trichothermofontia sichuanensis B231]
MSVRLYVGNLPKELERQELEAVFAETETVSTKVITDRKTGKCRGFGFVTVKTDEEADQLIEKFNGHLIHENPIKIEKALPRATKAKPEAQESVASTANNSGGGGNSSRRSKGKSSRRGGSTGGASQDTGVAQPDPRWAQELEKLKELLAAQTANS